ncbi:1215_t:CDS:2, partial [Paraglomus occultum]
MEVSNARSQKKLVCPLFVVEVPRITEDAYHEAATERVDCDEESIMDHQRIKEIDFIEWIGNNRISLLKKDIAMFLNHSGTSDQAIDTLSNTQLSSTSRENRLLAIPITTATGMFWARKSRRLEKGQFGVIGIQVLGRMFRLNVLIRDDVE